MEYIIKDIINEFSPLVNIEDRFITRKINDYVAKLIENMF